MNKKKITAFVSAFLGFLVVANLAIYQQGAFENVTYGKVGILSVSFLIVAGALYKYIREKDIH